MIPLFACQACGFLSTLGGEFTRINHVMFDKECVDKYEFGIEPFKTWVAEALVTSTAGIKARRVDVDAARLGSEKD